MQGYATPETPRAALQTIAVLGAGGRLGSTIVREAAARGHRIVLVTRTGAVPAEITLAGAHLEGRAADALDARALAGAVRGADVVVNALNPPYTAWPRRAMPMARAVIEACAATGAHHLFPGNVYAQGQSMPPVILPDTPEQPTSRKGAIRRDMEALFREAAQAGGVHTTILRAGDFFGGARPAGSWLDLVIAAKVKKGRFTYPGPMDVPHAWAYLPDLAHAFVDLAERHKALPPFAVLGFEGHTFTGTQLKAELEAAAGRPLKAARLSWPLVRAIGLVYPMYREIAEMAYLWCRPHRIDGSALAEIVGPPMRTASADALEAALAAMGQV